jgi:uncharacterized circularly permuted ATP-grasp superfamily protein
MREIIFRLGLLLFCLTSIASIGTGANLEDTLLRSTIVFFVFITIVYTLMYIFSKSQEHEMVIKTKLVDELLNDENFDILNNRIEERARLLMEQEKDIYGEDDDEHEEL